ncbi:hypothetical protein ZYGR_0N01260 [Zygosaccharomyces rouxii]|uniref:Potassium transport protein n=1 Tax=Zygosaccharomyces rouxii TaxID=4956 RepID=A0A1Q2ZZ63_ZYGRO|nr:hypothetical protein ZYGR_0N01260 [Zygosaccharomyces rouxii]
MISRTISRNPTLATFSVKYKESFGRKFRDAVAKTGHYVKPLRKYLFRNFLMVHYFYIISMTILASIILYPVRNESYIDILFLATGSTTQGGLNTVNINELELYQQIIIYIFTFLTTPIIIHSALAFVRLYWFERHFDGIRDSSKRNFKMRRTKTLLERELTARTMSKGRQRTGTRQFTSPTRRHDDFQEKLFSGKMVNRDEQDSLADLSHGGNGSSDQSVPNGKSFADPHRLSWSSSNTIEDNAEIHPSGRGLLFREPKPKRHQHYSHGNNNPQQRPLESFARRRRSTDISPEDMYRSISMMKGQRQTNTEDDGPALVIGAPAERSNDKDAAKLDAEKSDLKKKASYDSLRQNKMEKYPIGLPNKSDEEDFENEDEEDDDYNNDQTENSNSTSSSTSTTSNSSSVDNQSDNSPPIPSGSSTGSDSMHSDSVTSNAVTTDDRETMNEADSMSSDHSQPEFPQENRNGPSIHFDIAAPPKRKKLRDQPNLTRKSRRSHYSPGVPIPSAKSISQRLKRRLSLGPMEKPRAKTTRSSGDINTMNNSDDYFSKDGISDHFPRANTFDQQYDLQDDNFPDVLSKSHSFDLGKTKDWNKLSTSPEFQSMIYEKWKREKRGRKSILRPKIRRPSINSPNISGLRRFYSNPENNDDGNNTTEELPTDSVRHEHSDNDLTDEENDHGNFVNTRDSLDEEEGYFGNDLSLADDPSRHKLTRTLSANYLSWEPTVGRNSIFVNMTKEQKEELGGVEYRAIKLLCRILVVYYGGFWIMAFIFLVPWIVSRDGYRKIVRNDGVTPVWWGFFTGMSAFADLGLTLTPDSMMSFQTTSYPTIVMMWFIVIGNTGFPVLLRFMIWVMFQLSPDLSLTRESLGFLLDHPRRCFTMLFPSAATWWLVATLVGLNAIDLIIFVILDLGNSVLHNLNRGYRVLVGLFQAISTRTAGFQIVDIGSLHPAVQVSYMLMMYVSVMPLAISIRRTNVYEEQSLGVYGDPDEDASHHGHELDSDDDESLGSSPSPASKKKKKSTISFIGAHLRRQLSFDLWYIFLGLFIICLAEGGKIQDERRPEFNIFTILFEIVSAYGTVGLSLGYPNSDTSFSGQFGTISKLIIIALLIRGRHRGLPYTLDRAIMLPSDRLDNIDKFQDMLMRHRASREGSTDAVTSYFRSKLSAIKKEIHKMRTKSAEGEHLLHDFTDLPHHDNGDSRGDNHQERPSEAASDGYNTNYNNNKSADHVLDIHEEPKEVSKSPNDSSLQPQEPISYFPNTTPSPRKASDELSPSDPLSTIPSQGTPTSRVAPSLESYRMKPLDSARTN